MNQIYFPKDLNKVLKRLENKSHYILGYKLDSVYVVVQIVETSKFELRDGLDLKSAKDIYDKNETDNPETIPHSSNTSITHPSPDSSNFIQIIGGKDNLLQLSFDKLHNLPVVKNPGNFIIILFDPPNFKNLEYFSINPILLQSMGEVKSSPMDLLVDKLNLMDPTNNPNLSLANEEVLDKINQIKRTRILLENDVYELFISKIFGFLIKISSYPKNILLSIFIYCIMILQYLIIFILRVLNYNIRGHTMISFSQVLRQLDLRLKQLNYIPIQFICYYDKTRNTEYLTKLKLPIFNSNLNINNSNYINMHNSIWLIFNDILLGIYVHRLLHDNFDEIINFIHRKFIQEILCNDLLELISWVSINHPAGFKLNNELGKFMGDLYIWALKFWKYFINDYVEMHFSSHSKALTMQLLKYFLIILCYGGGISFLISFIIDIIQYLTIHIKYFYQTATKVYRKQIEILKSLFQLFRGKKFNILRDRIDNLNNYTLNDDGFEVDQFLLGTLLFMVLILLLPTVFAFYLMFFISQLLILICLNLLENLLITINFTPLFVILLKLKNSNRLQGGVNFRFISINGTSTYVKLSNKSLTYNEIFENYIKLFTQSKSFKVALVKSFIRGDLISLNHNYNMKFHYLMLPERFERTLEIFDDIVST